MAEEPHPTPATHGRTIEVGAYELAPGATLQHAYVGPIGASEYVTEIVLDVDSEAGTVELYRMADRSRDTIPVDQLARELDATTFVVDDGRDGD